MKYEWNEYTLEEIIDKFIDYRGKTPKKTTHGIPLITAKIVKDGRINPYQEYISEDDYDNWMTRGIPQEGAIILTTEAPMGEVAQLLTNEKVAFAQRIIVVEGNKDYVDNTFLKYLFQSPKFQHKLREKETGTTVTGIKSKELKKIVIDIPKSMDVQIRIATILNSLDRKIELNNQMIASLEELASTLFKCWFVKFEPFGGRKPQKWIETSLDSVSEVKGGKRMPKGTNLSLSPNSHPYIRVRDMNKSVFLNKNNSMEYVPDDVQSSISRYIVKTDDIIISIVGTIGLVSIVDSSLNNANLTENCVKLTNLDGITRSWLYLFLVSEKGQESIRKLTVGAVQQKLPIKNIKSITFNLPSSDALTDFDNLVKPILNRISVIYSENYTLSELQNKLLPKLMSGEFSLAD